MEPTQTISTIEVVRAGWPIVLGLIGAIVYIANVAFQSKQTAADFKSFKEKDYTDDKHEFSDSIKMLAETQRRAEEKLEARLNQMASKSDAQLNKVYEKLNETNILLAEMKGRLYPKSQDQNL